MAKPPSTSAGWARIERLVADVCACLEGDVHFTPRELPRLAANNNSLPLPWITVIFREEISSKTNDKATPNQRNIQNSSTPTSIGHKTNFINTNSVINNDYGAAAMKRQVQNKLVAIRVLSLVACCPEYSWRGNPRFWWHVLNDLCGSSHCDVYFSLPRASPSRYRKELPCCAPARALSEVHSMPKFQLIFSKSMIKNDLLEMCAQAFSPFTNDTFQRVDQQVQDVLTSLGIAIPQQQRSVKIDLDFSRSVLRLVDCMTGIRALLVATSGKSEANMPLSNVLFTIRCLDLSETMISERDLAFLTEIMTLPAFAISELKLNWVFTRKTSKRFTRSFCEFTAACFAISLPEPAATTSLTKLCLNSNLLNVFQLSSLFSAIHESNVGRCVRELSLHGFEGRDSWLWLAFGVFHNESKSPIISLDLSYCVLRLEDVEIVQKLLNATEYAPHLMQKKYIRESVHTSRSQPRQWGFLPVGTRLEVPRDREKHFRGPAVKLQTDLWCEVLESGVSWSCVLVPAYGRLYVKNSKLIKTEFRARSIHNCKLKTLTMVAVKTASQVLRVSDDGSLRGAFSAQSIDNVLLEWVKVVGQSLETLHLRSNPLKTRTLAVVLEACPLLRNMDVSGCELTDIEPITRAFKRDNCHLHTLKASQNHISVASQQALFQLLGDPECDSIRHLLVLHLDDNPTSPENRILNVLLAALRRNTTLRHLVLTMDEKWILSQRLRSRFDRDHHGKWLGHESLPPEHHFALLSVSMMKTLPTAVIKMILDFARCDIYRQVFWA